MLDVRLVQCLDRQTSPENAPGVLGMIGFGGLPGSDPPQGFPFAHADVPVLGQSHAYEVWESSLCVTRSRQDGIDIAHDGEILFGILQAEKERT